jgi:RPA family protein
MTDMVQQLKNIAEQMNTLRAAAATVTTVADEIRIGQEYAALETEFRRIAELNDAEERNARQAELSRDGLDELDIA